MEHFDYIQKIFDPQIVKDLIQWHKDNYKKPQKEQ